MAKNENAKILIPEYQNMIDNAGNIRKASLYWLLFWVRAAENLNCRNIY
jgi:hypothetical protein